MQLLQYLWDIAMSFLSFLGLVKPKSDNCLGGLEVYIKTGGNNILVRLESTWTISDVKELVASKLDIQPADVKIIFAGKELADSVCIEDCDLGQHSILHAVKIMKKHSESEDTASESLAPMCKAVTSLEPQSTSASAGENKRYFYVFCNICQRLCSGKLRVRCGKCRGGAFTVLKDPCCWNDVLQKEMIPGICDEEKCDGSSFAEIYFRCAEHVSQGEKDESVPLYLVKNNIHRVPCLVCSDVNDTVLVFECESSHVICVECFTAYCMSRLNERQFVSDPQHGYTLPCAAGCANSLILETHHFRLIGQQQYERYQRFGAEEYVLQQGGVLCPQPGCGMGIIPDCNRVACRGCNFVFCRLCLNGFHLGDCNMNERAPRGSEENFAVNPDASRWDDASRLAIRVITKPCPNCRTPTEKNGGCMHMECTRSSCQFHWCWICQTEWKRSCMSDHWFG